MDNRQLSSNFRYQSRKSGENSILISDLMASKITKCNIFEATFSHSHRISMLVKLKDDTEIDRQYECY